MPIIRNQLKLIWTAKAKLGLCDQTFRSALVQIAGVESTKDLNRDGFEAMMGYLEYLGFAPAQRMGEDFGQRAGMASFAQLEFIRDLWREYTDNAYGGGEDELGKWMERTFGVSCLRFLTVVHAQKAITALKAMKQRRA